MTPLRYATPFSLLHAVSLLSHQSRIRKFARVLQQIITPESYVVDIGTGTGVFALLAARAGARPASERGLHGATRARHGGRAGGALPVVS